MKVRNFLLLILVGIIFLGLGYKYFEWSILNKLAYFQNNFDIKEFDTQLQQQKVGKEVFELMDNSSEKDNKLSEEEQLKEFDEIVGKIKLYIDIEKNYLNLIKENQSIYQKTKASSYLLLGKRGSFAKDLILNQLNYYQKEIESVEESIISDELLGNIYRILKDFNILLSYDEKGTVNEANYSKYFSDIANIEKYSRTDFKFTEEDKIKELLPYGYETLNKYKKYFGSYYEMTKDFVAEDKESAYYKYATFIKESLELNIDYDKLSKEGEERKINRAKDIISFTLNKISSITHFKSGKLGYYPFLQPINNWKEDLILCQLYSYKTSLYQTISGKTIKISNIDELFNELSQLSPKTDDMDKLFKRDILTIKGLEEKEKYITFECKDEITGKVYPFDVTKKD